MTVAARRLDAAETVAGLASGADAVPLADCDPGAYALVVNATPLGMQGEAPAIDPARLNQGQFVVDTVYHPMETPLLAAARARGIPCANGLGMLVHQAALAFELWTGVEAPLDGDACGSRGRFVVMRLVVPGARDRSRGGGVRGAGRRRRLAPRPGDRAGAAQGAGARPADAPTSLRRRRCDAPSLALLCGALFGATGARFDDSWALPAYLVLAGALVALSAIDLEHYLLPNRIVYPLTGAMVVLLGLASLGDDDLDALVRGLAAGAIVFVVFFVLHLISPRSMGFGDVKLSFTLGLALGWLGWGELFLGVFLAFVFGAVVGIVLMLFFRRGRKQALPFGPFLAAGTLTAVLVGQAIITWYTNGS